MIHEQYVDRTIDILAFRGGQGSPGAVLLEQRLSREGDPGQVCTGVQKLVQRFVIALFTIRGSVRANPEFGTDFLSRVTGGFVHNGTQLMAEFAAAEVELAPLLARESRATDPADEVYRKATAISADVSRGHLRLRVQLETASETSVQFILPVLSLTPES